jgi:hypothetical protein
LASNRDIRNRPAQRQGRGDDGAGGSAAHQIEPVGKPEFRTLPRVLAQQCLDPRQEGQFDDALGAAAIQRKDPLLAGAEQMPVAPGCNVVFLRQGRFLSFRYQPHSKSKTTKGSSSAHEALRFAPAGCCGLVA